MLSSDEKVASLMITYRICKIGRDGRFTGPPEVVECADDAEAVDKALQLTEGLDVEIWDHKRFVARLPGQPLRFPARARG
jgi:hypothetical protein